MSEIEEEFCLCKVFSYLKLKVKYDAVMPINSHVTSEGEK